MEIADKDLFISEYVEIKRDKKWLDFVEKVEKQIKEIRSSVFTMYTSERYVENQVYNSKNEAVEKLNILLDVKNELEKLSHLSGIKYLLSEVEDRIEGQSKYIETAKGGFHTMATMSVYTETDLMILGADTLEAVLQYYDKAVEEFKKKDSDDSTLSDVVTEE